MLKSNIQKTRLNKTLENMKKITLIIILILSALVLHAQKDIQYGKASFYANKFEGRTTASGEKYWHSKLTAAHRTLPFNTRIRVTNLSNNQTVVVRVNDRGPFVKDRIIDLSKSAARKLDFIKDGVCNVKLEVLDRPQEKNNATPIVKEAGTGKLKAEGKGGESVQFKPKFYNLSVESKRPIGYGVQLASYKEMVNLLERVRKIQSKLRQDITIQVTSVDGMKVYRIVAGQFDNRIKAERFKESIRDDFPGCFIFKF